MDCSSYNCSRRRFYFVLLPTASCCAQDSGAYPLHRRFQSNKGYAEARRHDCAFRLSFPQLAFLLDAYPLAFLTKTVPGRCHNTLSLSKGNFEHTFCISSTLKPHFNYSLSRKSKQTLNGME